jgi:hypothetical protein
MTKLVTALITQEHNRPRIHIPEGKVDPKPYLSLSATICTDVMQLKSRGGNTLTRKIYCRDNFVESNG